MVSLSNILISIVVFSFGAVALIGASLVVQHNMEHHIKEYIV